MCTKKKKKERKTFAYKKNSRTAGKETSANRHLCDMTTVIRFHMDHRLMIYWYNARPIRCNTAVLPEVLQSQT